MRNKKVIVIDDDRVWLKIFEKGLTSFGFQVVAVTDGLKAVEIVKKVKPDAVIMDVVMPGVSGYELLAELKKNPLTKHIPVMMLTVKSLELDVERGLEIGADDYISKPPQMDLLVKRLERLLK